jgi:hypothetical protein
MALYKGPILYSCLPFYRREFITSHRSKVDREQWERHTALFRLFRLWTFYSIVFTWLLRFESWRGICCDRRQRNLGASYGVLDGRGIFFLRTQIDSAKPSNDLGFHLPDSIR